MIYKTLNRINFLLSFLLFFLFTSELEFYFNFSLKYLLNKVVLFVKPILERVCGGAFVNKPHHAIKIQQFLKLSIYHSKTELKFVKLFELEFLELQHLSRIL